MDSILVAGAVGAIAAIGADTYVIIAAALGLMVGGIVGNGSLGLPTKGQHREQNLGHTGGDPHAA